MEYMDSDTTIPIVDFMDQTTFFIMDQLLSTVRRVLLFPLRLVMGIALLIHVGAMLKRHQKSGLHLLLDPKDLEDDLMYPKHNESAIVPIEEADPHFFDLYLDRNSLEDLDEHAYHLGI